MFAICPLSVIPVRKEPSDKSEMVSQFLFGETMELLSKEGNWRKVRSTYDDYVGWVDSKQIHPLENADFAVIESQPVQLSIDLVQVALRSKTELLPVLIGSVLRGYNGKIFSIGGIEYEFEGNVVTPSHKDPSMIMQQSYMFLNAPYLWGGRSPFGIDCSGFTQLIFKLCGIKLKRDAYQQAEQGSLVNLFDESAPGDLAFFDNAEKKIIHVGIILPGQQIIHASGKVRIDRIDHQGIFNRDTGNYTHNLRLIKRFS